MTDSPLFGIIPTGQPLITTPGSLPSQTSFLYHLPTARPFSHITVFLLPNVTLPPSTAAAIYLSSAADVYRASQSGTAPNFKFLGGIGPGKESAVFKVGSGQGKDGVDELVIGIDVEEEQVVGQKLQELQATRKGDGNTTSTGGIQPSTTVLAQRIIQNAFNFLSGFSGQAAPGGEEVVPLRAFENWWKKFESRVRSDPSFLEQQGD